MVSKYMVGALCDALAEAAKERDLESIKEIYLALNGGQMSVVQVQLGLDSVLPTSQPELDKSLEKSKKQISDFYSRGAIPYTTVLNVFESKNVLNRFSEQRESPFPCRFSIQELYEWIHKQDDLCELRQSTKFRERLTCALHNCSIKSFSARGFKLSSHVSKVIHEGKPIAGWYTYDPRPKAIE